MKEFDDMTVRVGEMAEKALRDGAVIHLEHLLSLIAIHECETVSHVKGLIHNKLDELKGEGDE